jgi:hypothetical protein
MAHLKASIMPTQKPVSVSKLFSGGILPQLLEHGRVLTQLNRILSRTLPPPLADHCQVLNLRQHTLTLGVDGPLWASRLRYQTRTLLQQLAQVESVTVHTIQVKIRPEPGPKNKKPCRNSRLSADNARLLQQTANTLGDERLRAALLRVASRGEKPEAKG